MAGNLDRKLRLPRINFRILLHATYMRHGTNGYTSLPKEGVLRFFRPEKSDGFGLVWTRELEYQRQHATSRPRKPHYAKLSMISRIWNNFRPHGWIRSTWMTEIHIGVGDRSVVVGPQKRASRYGGKSSRQHCVTICCVEFSFKT